MVIHFNYYKDNVVISCCGNTDLFKRKNEVNTIFGNNSNAARC